MHEYLPDPPPAPCTDGHEIVTINGWRVCCWCDLPPVRADQLPEPSIYEL